MTSVSALSLPSATTQASSKASSQLDENAFLKLMTTQLQTQDPFNPVDNTQMVAQLAQFSQVSGIAEMNASLKTLVSSLGSSTRVADAASWIGRTALVASDQAAPLADGRYAGQIGLAAEAAQVGLDFVDASGAIVHSMTLGPQAKGAFDFAWDGKNADGAAVPGPLELVVTAANADGEVAASTAAWTPVSAVQSPANGGTTRLVTGLGLIDPADALRLG